MIVLIPEYANRVYTLTAGGIVSRVRTLTNDGVEPYRTSTDEILGWLNDALKAMLPLSPQQFMQVANHTCAFGARQFLSQERAYALVEVVGVAEADYTVMSAFDAQWPFSAQGGVQNWLRATDNPCAFYVYPQSPPGQVLTVRFVQAHTDLTATTDVILLPETYAPALVAYCVSMVESKDDEHVNSNRAQAAMADFVGRITGGKA